MKKIKASEISRTIAEILEPKPKWIDKRTWTTESENECWIGHFTTDGVMERKEPLDFEHDPRGTVMLLENMREPDLWLESNPGEIPIWGCNADISVEEIDKILVAFAETLGQAVARAFLFSHDIEVED